MAEDVVVSADSIKATDKDGNTYTIKTDGKRDKDGKVKVEKTFIKGSKEQKLAEPKQKWDIGYSTATKDVSSWGTDGNFLIEVHCEADTPYVKLTSKNDPTFTVEKKNLANHDAQNKMIDALKKLLGEGKKK